MEIHSWGGTVSDGREGEVLQGYNDAREKFMAPFLAGFR